MATLAASTIRHVPNASSTQRYEAVPAWLVSMAFHMIVVIALGMLHISTQTGGGLKLLFMPSESVGDAEPEEGLADLDLALEANSAPLSVVDDSAAPLSTHEMLTSLDVELPGMGSSKGDIASLVAGLGEGPLGEGSGGTNVTSLFGLAGEGGDFVYVFDRSQSMSSVFTLFSNGQVISSITPLQSAKMELARSLASLKEANRFQIVFYNDSPTLFGESHYDRHLFKATPKNKERANEFVHGMEARGFTNHLAALEMAIDLEPDVIFLLTDGEAKDDLHPSVIRRMYKYCQKKKITVNVIHFHNRPRDDSTFVRLAEKSGGQHIFISLQSLAESLIDPVAL